MSSRRRPNREASFTHLLAYLLILVFALIGCSPAACSGNDRNCAQATEIPTDTPGNGDNEMTIDKEKALEIAQQDALIAYRNLDIYEVDIELQDGNWKIDYEIKDPNMQGGGPHYIVSSETGEILSKRYEQ